MDNANYVTGVNNERTSCFHKHKITFLDLVLFSATGVYLIVIGSIIMIKCKYFSFLPNYNLMFLPSVVFICAGIGFLLAGLLMYYYDMCRKKNSLQIHENYFLLISLFVIIFYAISCFSSAYCFNVDRNDLNGTMQIYDPENRTRLSAQLDYFQVSFRCCGVEEHSEWKSTAYGKEPDSCYSITNGYGSSNETRKLLTKGCYSVMRYHFYEIVVYFIWVTVSVVNVLCGCMMYKHIGCSVTDLSHGLRRSIRKIFRKNYNPRRSEARIWIHMTSHRPRHVWEVV